MAGRKVVTQCTAAEWRSMCRRVKSCIPPPEGYAWRFVWSTALEGDEGDCSRVLGKDGRLGTFRIRVAKGLSEKQTIDVLLHECAHAFDWTEHHGWLTDHSSTFWIWLGRLFRRYHGLE